MSLGWAAIDSAPSTNASAVVRRLVVSAECVVTDRSVAEGSSLAAAATSGLIQSSCCVWGGGKSGAGLVALVVRN